MGEIAIGIDLGTSNSCVAVAQGGQVEVLANACGEYTTASVVAIAEDGAITVGNAAKARIIHDPANTVYSSKRLIGRYFFSEEVKKARAICSYDIAQGPNNSLRIKIREELFTLPEVSAMVLREMKSIAEARLGRPVSKAVITVPAYFNDNQRQATKDAGRIAGLDVLRILNEPTAAALAYGFGKGLSQRVAVYDLGGGTFDISVLEFGEDVFEVLATCGDTFLGGDDFDDRVIDLLADEFQAQEGVNLRNDPYALEKLKLAAESAKKSLSVDDEVQICIPDVIIREDGSTASLERTLRSAEFSALVNDLMLRTFKVCDEALQQAGVVASDLDGVILVGGPTRLPVIREAVREYFQQEPKSDVDPDRAVAMGAAIHAASLASSSHDAYLLDVTPLSLRIGVAGGLAEPVIERNTPVPIEQTRTFTTFQDFQESVNIRVYQGESREAQQNELLGQFEFSGFDKAARGQVAIDVTFEINADGIVNVTATDRATGQQASTRITLSSGLSEGEIETIIETARTDRLRSDAPAAAATHDDEELIPLEDDVVVHAAPPQPESGFAEPGTELRAAGPELSAPEPELSAEMPELGAEEPELTAPEPELAAAEPVPGLVPERSVPLAPRREEPVALDPEAGASDDRSLLDGQPDDLLPDDPIELTDLSLAADTEPELGEEAEAETDAYAGDMTPTRATVAERESLFDVDATDLAGPDEDPTEP